MNVLLVTGSRSLTKQVGAEDAVETILRRFEQRLDLVIAGDADGPDRWALRHAHSFDGCCERFSFFEEEARTEAEREGFYTDEDDSDLCEQCARETES